MKLSSVYAPVEVEECQSANSFVCGFCNILFSSQSDLDLHQEKTSLQATGNSDSTTEELVCKLCSQEFLTFRGMRQHYGKVHSSVKRTKCKLCNKKFKDKYAVKYHRIQVHEKKTQIECYLCRKVLYNKFSFKKHIPKCSQKFFDEDNLTKLEFH